MSFVVPKIKCVGWYEKNNVFSWVNEQDFDRATPEPDHVMSHDQFGISKGARDRLDLTSDIYAKLPGGISLPIINAQWPHMGAGAALTPTLGLERLLDPAYLTNIIQPNPAQGLTAGII